MNFPSFGDAATYDRLGAKCAAALTGGEGLPFTECYDPLRPLGIIAYYTLPHLFSADPVVRVYMALAGNLIFFALIHRSLTGLLCGDRAGTALRALESAFFVILLANFLPHLPVTLSDLPSLAVFMLAAGQWRRDEGHARPAGSRRWVYFGMGLLVAVATLLKQNYIVAGTVLALGAVLFEKTSKRRHKVCYLLFFALGASPVLAQFASVYLHSGEFWLYETEVVRRFFSHVGDRPNVEAFFHSLPKQGAFMIKVAGEIDSVSFVTLKLYRGLFFLEWAVYKGLRGATTEYRVVGLGDLLRAYGLVGTYLAVTVGTLVRGPRALRLLGLVALSTAATNAVMWHTEARYYLLPRIVFSATLVYWAFIALETVLRGRGRADGGLAGATKSRWS